MESSNGGNGMEMRPENGQLDLLGSLQAPFEPPVDETPLQRRQTPAPDVLADPVKQSVPQGRDSHGGEGPQTLLILDTETTGLDPRDHHCLEVGAILFDVSEREVLAQQSFLLPVETNPAQTINHIPARATQRPQPWNEGLRYLEALLNAADLLVAHHAAFDRQWFGHGRLPAVKVPWLCTMEDVPWPADLQLRPRPSVRDLALAHGIPVWSVHRALADCIYIAEVFRRREDLEELIRLGLEPRMLMRAQVSYDQRHLAREAGFRWNDPVAGAWTRRLSAREAKCLAFSVVVLEEVQAERLAS